MDRNTFCYYYMLLCALKEGKEEHVTGQELEWTEKRGYFRKEGLLSLGDL